MCLQLSKFRIAGSVESAPEVRYTTGENRVPILRTVIKVVINDRASLIPIKAVGAAAERLEKMNLQQNSFLRVHGSFINEPWTDREGRKHTDSVLLVSESYPAAIGYYENVALIAGHLSKDVDFYAATADAKSFARFSVAVNRKDKERTADFLNVVAFDKNAENISKYFSKSSPIYCEGRLVSSEYTDRKTGEARTSYEVQLYRWEFMERKSSSGQKGVASNTVSASGEAAGFVSAQPAGNNALFGNVQLA